jgi:hypothetical protein
MRTLLLGNALIVILIASTFWHPPLVAQWRVGAEVGAARFWGASRENSPDQPSFRPYRPTTFGVGLERQTGRYTLGLQVQYGEASLALEGPEVVVSAEGVFTFVSISPEVSLRVVTLGSDNQIRMHAGPVFDVWDIIDQDSRTRVGAQGSLSLDVPLGGSFQGVVLAGIAVTPSLYNEGELDLGGGAPSYDLETMWRRRFALGLQYRL